VKFPVYDDGNLLSDGRNGLIDEGRWVYLWDAENRLIQMESTAAAVTAGMPYTKLTFEYNWEGKRVARHVWRGGSSGSPTAATGATAARQSCYEIREGDGREPVCGKIFTVYRK
jgi:hypothetical protein